MFSFLKRLFKRKPDDLKRKQYEQIGRIIVHGAMTDRTFNRAISRLPLYPKLLDVIGLSQEQKKVRLFVKFWHLGKKK